MSDAEEDSQHVEEEDDDIIDEDEEEEVSEDEEDESEEEELDESQFEGLNEADKIKKMILLERERHQNTLQKLESQREKVNASKSSIGKLIQQITDYKQALEQETTNLESELVDKEEQLEQEKATTTALKQSIQNAETERDTLLESIKQLEKQHEQALEQENKIKNKLQQETVQNLQTLMDELQRIEEANSLLRTQHEKSKLQIQEEEQAHATTVADLAKEREKAEQIKQNLESLKLTNEALLNQLRQYRRVSAPPRPTQLRSSTTSNNNNPSDAMSTSMASIPQYVQQSISQYQTQETSPRLEHSSSTNNSPRGLSAAPSFVDVSPPETPRTEGYQYVRKLQPAHDSGITCCIIVGGQMWIGCKNGTIRIWEIETGQMLEDRTHHTGAILCLLLVKDRVWSSARDKAILIWSPKKAVPEKKFVAAFKDKDIFGTSMLEVDQFVWSGCNDGTIRLWDVKVKKELKVDNHGITCMMKRTNQVWTGNELGLIHIWNTTTLRPIKTINAHSKPINSFTYIGPTSYPFEIWSCSSDNSIKCWHAESYDCVKTLAVNTNITCLLQVRSVHHVWAGGEDSGIYVWNAKTYELAQELVSQQTGPVMTLVLDKRNQIWTGSADGTICIWR